MSVEQVGTDSSGRQILMSVYMRRWWAGVVREVGFTPTIVQGAFMSRVPGGGASASAGYHDKGGCLDVRTWDLTPFERDRLVWVLRCGGAGAWVRDARHGMDPHIHLVLGADDDLAQAAAEQWTDYRAGLNGLANRGPDYHDRPVPLVVTPPDDYMEDPVTPEQIEKTATLAAAKVLASQITVNRGKDTERTLTVEQLLRELRQNA